MKDLKTFIFTHNDLDGIGCGVIGKYYFPDAYVQYCSYDNIDNTLLYFLTHNKNILSEMRIIISDIYYKQENSDITEMLRMAGELIIADHHATSTWLNNVIFQHNSFVSVVADSDVCGTKILFKILDVLNPKPSSTKFLEFVENVNRWDIWQWVKYLPETNDVDEMKDAINHNMSFTLNGAVYFYGIENFVNKMLMYFHDFIDFDDIVSEKLVEFNIKQINSVTDYTKAHYEYESEYYGKIPYTIIKLNSPNISLASLLCKNAMELDDKFLAIYIDEDKDTVSLRCNVEGIDLSVIAKECEGGGHKDAAGCKRLVLLGKSK